MVKQRWFFAVIAAVFLVASGCSSNKGSERSYTKATLKISIDAKAIQAAKYKAARTKSLSAVGTVADVASVTVDVMEGSTALYTGEALTNTDGVWSVSLDLPIGAQLTFTAHAYNSAGEQIFTGMASKMLQNQNDEIMIPMAPSTNGQTLQFPVIGQVSRPASIGTSQTVPVSISLQGTAGETLSYQVTAGTDGGTFEPASGSITLAGTSASVILNYTAPAVVGTYTHSISVTNSLNNNIQTTFTTNVISTNGDPTVIVQFNPVITGISAGRNGSDVIFSAQVSDSGPANELTYLWSFNGDLTFADNTSNPATLQGYSDTVTGLLTLRVANAAGGHTTVSYQIKSGQFPGMLANNTLILPQALIMIGGACQMSGTNGSVISLMIDEQMAQEDLNNDGDMYDNILGYYDLSTHEVVKLNIAIGNNIAIAGDIMAYTLEGSNKLGWYTFSDQTLHDVEIYPDRFGRNSSYVSRLVSGTKIAYVATGKLNIYDTATGENITTNESVPDAGSPSFSGSLIAFVGTAGTLRYYNVATGGTTDTGEFASDPVIDNGTIVYDTADGKVAYYVTSTGMNVITPITNMYPGDGHPSISNGILAAFQREGGDWGDLNGDGIIDENMSFLVLYDIPTGKLVSTGIMLCCGVDINGFLITVCQDNPCGQRYTLLTDVVKQYFGR